LKAKDRASRDLNLKIFKGRISKELKNMNNERAQRKRNMSPAVISRWYRPPEVVLCDQNYNQSCDVWSLGCVLAEMLNCTEKQLEKRKNNFKKRIMFRGESCYPISPFKNNNDGEETLIDNKDQIIKILNKF
jgi:serine/threonine protein kinase